VAGDASVTDPQGRASGQKMLDTFVEEFALNLPKFLAMPDREKAEVLLQTMGIGEKLAELDRTEAVVYNQRTLIGQDADSKKKHAQELTEFPDAGLEIRDATDIANEVTAAVQHNARVRELRGKRRAVARHQRGGLARGVEFVFLFEHGVHVVGVVGLAAFLQGDFVGVNVFVHVKRDARVHRVAAMHADAELRKTVPVSRPRAPARCHLLARLVIGDERAGLGEAVEHHVRHNLNAGLWNKVV